MATVSWLLSRDSAKQETGHAFAHFHLLHPELVINDQATLGPERIQQILARCLQLAIAGETYAYTTMVPDFAAQARWDCHEAAAHAFEGQSAEARDHAALFQRAASTFGFLMPDAHHHAQRYGVALQALDGSGRNGEASDPEPGRWICKVCSIIDDPAVDDPESGIAPGTPFEVIPDTGTCPICSTRKTNFIRYHAL